MEYNIGDKILCGNAKNMEMYKYITIFADYASVDVGKNKVSLIDLDDVDKIKNNNWYIHKAGMVMSRISSDKHVKLHRYIMDFPTGKDIDHINHDKLDNRKSNLRICSHKQNARNTKKMIKETSSIYKGVSFRSNYNNWRSFIKTNEKQIHLGIFENEIDAAIAYNNKALELFGEYANLNIII